MVSRRTAPRAADGGAARRGLLSIADLSARELAAIVDGGLRVKRAPARYRQHLRGVAVALLFQKTSTRTRCSFEVGVAEMGGQPLVIEWGRSNFTVADLGDESRVLSRYVGLIAARLNRHGDLVTMSRSAAVPVINGLTDLEHPCQILADLMTIKESLGRLAGVKIAFIGDGNNVCNSLILGASLAAAPISVACPRGFEPDAAVVRAAGTGLQLCRDPREAVRGADVVYTDTWVSLGQERERARRLRAFRGYQVNRSLLAGARAGALVMHCLPAHRGEEISSDVIDSERSVVFEQAENRKHVQKYLMAWILGRG